MFKYLLPASILNGCSTGVKSGYPGGNTSPCKYIILERKIRLLGSKKGQRAKETELFCWRLFRWIVHKAQNIWAVLKWGVQCYVSGFSDAGRHDCALVSKACVLWVRSTHRYKSQHLKWVQSALEPLIFICSVQTFGPPAICILSETCSSDCFKV